MMTNINITKEDIEKQLGYEVQDFNATLVYSDTELIGINIQVVPKRAIEYVIVNFNIMKDGCE